MAYLTIFSAPKPFTNPHIAMIQRNAICSWKELGPEVDVLLLGDEDGLAYAAHDLGVRYIPDIRCSQGGTPLISSMISQARENSDSPVFVLINADIILLPGFVESIQQTAEQSDDFLVIGQRWDLDLTELLDFKQGWDQALIADVHKRANLHKAKGSDYFVFRREQFQEYPDFVIGRSGWDNWTIYHARAMGWKVVDASHDIQVIHQQHDYSHLPGGKIHYRHPESDVNLELAGGRRFIFNLLDANSILVDGQILPYPRSKAKNIRDFEIWPVLHSHSRFLMDCFYYLTHPAKFIRHKLPGVAKLFGILQNEHGKNEEY